MTDWKEFIDQVKLARDSALLGNYETAIVYYQSAINAIKQFLSKTAMRDSERRHAWNAVKIC